MSKSAEFFTLVAAHMKETGRSYDDAISVVAVLNPSLAEAKRREAPLYKTSEQTLVNEAQCKRQAGRRQETQRLVAELMERTGLD